MNEKVIAVSSRSNEQIRLESERVLRNLMPKALEKPIRFPIAEILEFKLKKEYGFDLAVEELPEGVEGYTEMKGRLLVLSESTYCDNDDPRNRFTQAHEFGHVVLHSREITHRLTENLNAIKTYRKDIPPYKDPECQANTFASCILMPEKPFLDLMIENCSTNDIAAIFGVSYTAAKIRREKLEDKFYKKFRPH
ncbi:ImmA/IrrE family metallo-endopeptidase [Leptospira levettii]|uniref:ImmA/IrrE family metallo-endopeptidase n=1 Tax=Leptospira levettii TaxID=2023178 RepID=UPI00108263EA|nr:ImmA/IrrE family metallo-endopeptidase [Leptospira levettii]TGM35682.1 ImmA/IrrE family metallo-endopeptidase [Leptospira levettii]